MNMSFDDSDNDFVPEDDASESAYDDVDATEGNALARIKELKEELKKCVQERKEYLDGWQRAKADYLNSTKRFAQERGEIQERSETSLIEKILPLCDSFDMALREGNGEGGAWKEGFSRINTQLTSILKGLGVEAIDKTGVPFDPHQHEALTTQPVASKEQNDTVLTILQKGYTRRDTLIRPAKVVIGHYEG